MNKCYVCMEETIYKSPCECKLFLCKDCFKKLLKNNIKILKQPFSPGEPFY